VAFGRGLLLDRDTADLCGRRSDTQFPFEILKLMGGADGQDFYAAVLQIPRPAAHAEIPSGPLDEIAVSNPLDLSRNEVFTS